MVKYLRRFLSDSISEVLGVCLSNGYIQLLSTKYPLLLASSLFTDDTLLGNSKHSDSSGLYCRAQGEAFKNFIVTRVFKNLQLIIE